MDEKEWIKRIVAGDTQMFSCLVAKYERMAYTIAFRILGNKEEAEEATQDAFVRMYRALPRFQSACRWFSRRLERIFEMERNRLFNDIDFSYTLVVGEKKNIRLLLFAQMKGKKILYVPYDREFNDNVSPLVYRKYDQILIEDPKVAEAAMKKYADCAI